MSTCKPLKKMLHRLGSPRKYPPKAAKMLSRAESDTLGSEQNKFNQAVRVAVTSMQEMTATMKHLREELRTIQSSQLELLGKLNAVQNGLQHATALANDNATQIEDLSLSGRNLESRVVGVMRQLNYVEQLNMDCDTVVSCVEETTDENTTEIVHHLAKLLDVDTNNIQLCTRMKSLNATGNSNILVRFNDWDTKQVFVKRSRAKQITNKQLGTGSHRRIFVNHRFTTTYQRLNNLTREICKRSDCTSWYWRGRFFLKHANGSTITIQSTDDIPPELLG